MFCENEQNLINKFSLTIKINHKIFCEKGYRDVKKQILQQGCKKSIVNLGLQRCMIVKSFINTGIRYTRDFT